MEINIILLYYYKYILLYYVILLYYIIQVYFLEKGTK